MGIFKELVDAVYGLIDDNSRTIQVSPFSNEAIAFGNRLLSENNFMVYDLARKMEKEMIDCINRSIDETLKHATSNYIPDETKSLYICVGEKNISLYGEKDYDIVDQSNNYMFPMVISTITEYNYNLLSEAENFKKYGIIYALLELICPYIREQIPNICNINVDTEENYKQVYDDQKGTFCRRPTGTIAANLYIGIAYQSLNRFTTL